MQSSKTQKAKKLQLTEQDRKDIRIALARKSLPAFVEYVLRDMDGASVTNAAHHLAWWEHINYAMKIGKVPLILAPMSFSKTSWISIALPLWLLGQNENFRIILVSSAETIAAERLEAIKAYIEQSPEYKEVFPWIIPDKRKPWNNTRMTVKRHSEDGGMVGSFNASVAAFGYTSREGIGARCDILILDDVVDESNSVISPSSRENLKQLVRTQWMTRCEPSPLRDRYGHDLFPRPLICGVGTMYHEEDFYSDCIKNPVAFCTLVQGVSDDFECLDGMIHGSLDNPVHPVYSKYRDWSFSSK